MSEEKLPLVSVAVITYNQKEFLRECIESILDQDYSNLQIVIADDGSTDGTQDMLRDYTLEYPDKFELRLSEKNQGITVNSNEAHFACTGKYIAWIGGDDLMLPGKISTQVKYMENNPDCTICYHNLDVFESETNKNLYYFNSKLKINGNVQTSTRFGTFNGACSNMVRSSKAPLEGFNLVIPVASDWLYWVESLANGGTINYIDQVLGRYRRHQNNITRPNKDISQNDLDRLVSCQVIIAKFPEYFNDAIYVYSKRLMGLRNKVNYPRALWRSFCIRPSIKAAGALGLYIVSLGRVKV